MELSFRAVAEDQPGPRWAALFAEHWPAYQRWWEREGLAARPTYLGSRKALAQHMPELVELYDQLCALAGGGDVAARFLSFYRPPPYLAGCSQAIWPGEEPILVRNYDYDPHAFDALILHTGWQGRRVMGLSDGGWGLVDGVNEVGLAVSLTFGGRRACGDGFGVPLILRYILQTCETTKEAVATLQRVPCHMSYNVTVLDKARSYATVFLAPDRSTVVTGSPAATNHQQRVEWSSHARFTATVERERFLLNRLTLHMEPAERFIGAFLRPPLYSTAFDQGFGTLYTAVYRPGSGALTMHWPDSTWALELESFDEATRYVRVPVFSNGQSAER
ncbi:MAG: C45 family peptidase [Pseudomonadota bacterium]